MSSLDLNDLWDRKLKGWAWQVKEEFLSLLALMQNKKIRTVLEIGCYDGGTAAGFLSIGCSVTSVDVKKRPKVEDLEQVYPKHFTYVDRKTADGIFAKQRPGFTDMLFIDGDHSYKGVVKDYMYFVHTVAPGGIVVFHDIVNSDLHKEQECEVWRCWQEIRGKNFTEFVYDGKWGGIGVKYL